MDMTWTWVMLYKVTSNYKNYEVKFLMVQSVNKKNIIQHGELQRQNQFLKYYLETKIKTEHLSSGGKFYNNAMDTTIKAMVKFWFERKVSTGNV